MTLKVEYGPDRGVIHYEWILDPSGAEATARAKPESRWAARGQETAKFIEKQLRAEGSNTRLMADIAKQDGGDAGDPTRIAGAGVSRQGQGP